MTTWIQDPADFHADAVIEFRDGDVPVLIHQMGRYPAGGFRRTDGTRLVDTEYVDVAVGGVTTNGVWSPDTVVVTRSTGYGPNGRSVVRAHGQEKGVGVADLIARAAPRIRAALADDSVRADQQTAQATIDAAVATLPDTFSRADYEAWCAARAIAPDADEAIATSYALEYFNIVYPMHTVDVVIATAAARCRLRSIKAEREAQAPASRAAELVPGTAAAALAGAGLDPIALGGQVIGGVVFKPDASRAPAGVRCGVCGTTRGVAWIAGAGQALCAAHQDDY